MSSKQRVFEDFRLYAVTDLREDDLSVLAKIEAAYAGGVDIVQLRSKTLNDHALYRIGREIRAISERMGKLFFVNDRPDLALALKADGVHLGQEDMPFQAARALCRGAGRRFWIGRSTHRIDQALEAESEGADYVAVGPVFATPTKPGRKAAGLEYVREVSAQLKIPLVAIGGIDATNIRQVLEAGARRIAVVRALFGGDDAYQAAQRLRSEIDQFQSLAIL